MRDGPFYPGDGLERIVAYHERQDARFAQAAAEISDATGKPILTATELAVAVPDNPGPRDGRARPDGSATRRRNRAVTALGHLWRYARVPRAARPRVTEPRRTRAGRERAPSATRPPARVVRRRSSSSRSCSSALGAARRRAPRRRHAGRDARHPAVVGCAGCRSRSSTTVGAQRLQAGARRGRRDGLQTACFVRRRHRPGRRRGDRRRHAAHPGITQKLLTATAALDVLGADFRYTTKAVAPGAPKDGDGRPPLARRRRRPAAHHARSAPRASRRDAADQGRPDHAAGDARRRDRRRPACSAIPGGIVGRRLALRPHPVPLRVARPVPHGAEIGPLGALTVNDGFAGPDGTGAAAADPAVNAAAELAPAARRPRRGRRPGRARQRRRTTPTTHRDARLAAAAGRPRGDPRVERQPHRRAAHARARRQGRQEGTTANGVAGDRRQSSRSSALPTDRRRHGRRLRAVARQPCAVLAAARDARARRARRGSRPIPTAWRSRASAARSRRSLRGTPLAGQPPRQDRDRSAASPGSPATCDVTAPARRSPCCSTAASPRAPGTRAAEQMAQRHRGVSRRHRRRDALVPGPSDADPARACRDAEPRVDSPTRPSPESRQVPERPPPLPAGHRRALGARRRLLQAGDAGPLKSLGRVVGFGLAGRSLLGFGVVFVAVGGLRLLQDETGARSPATGRGCPT